MPAETFTDPTRVMFLFSDATRYTVQLHHLPCQRLVADLACGMAAMAHPHGTINTAGTAVRYRIAVGQLARFLDGIGFRGGAAELTRAKLVEFWLGTKHDSESATRRMLRAWDADTGGLRPEVRDYLDGGLLNRQARRTPLTPYSDAEWDRLLSCCRRVVEAAWAARREAIAVAQTGQDPAVGGWSPENMLWLQLNHGPWSQQQVADHMGCSLATVAKYGRVIRAARALFPTLDVAFAYRLLLGMSTGIVPDGLDDLGIGDIDWAGDATILLDYVKGRSGPQSLTLPKPAVRVLRRWLEHSESLRQRAPDAIRSRLWLAYTPAYPFHTALFDPESVRSFVDANLLADDDKQPLRIHRARLRTTFANRRDKRAWTGRTTIDPNHTAQVEGDNYLSQPSPTQREALHAVIEDAQADLVRKATTAAVVTNQDPVAVARDLPTQMAGLKLTHTVIAELVGGQRDVFTAACADQLAGLHGPAGQPCPARPWVCLLCPLAVFAPRHALNLLRLKAEAVKSSETVSCWWFGKLVARAMRVGVCVRQR